MRRSPISRKRRDTGAASRSTALTHTRVPSQRDLFRGLVETRKQGSFGTRGRRPSYLKKVHGKINAFIKRPRPRFIDSVNKDMDWMTDKITAITSRITSAFRK